MILEIMEEKLPFVLIRQVVLFLGARIPLRRGVKYKIRTTLSKHFQKRYCSRCGEYISSHRNNNVIHCFCRFRRYRYTVESNRFLEAQLFPDGMIGIQPPIIDILIFRPPSFRYGLLFVFSFKSFLRKRWITHPKMPCIYLLDHYMNFSSSIIWDRETFVNMYGPYHRFRHYPEPSLRERKDIMAQLILKCRLFRKPNSQNSMSLVYQGFCYTCPNTLFWMNASFFQVGTTRQHNTMISQW